MNIRQINLINQLEQDVIPVVDILVDQILILENQLEDLKKQVESITPKTRTKRTARTTSRKKVNDEQQNTK